MKIISAVIFSIGLLLLLFIWQLRSTDDVTTEYRENVQITRPSPEWEDMDSPQKGSEPGNDFSMNLKDHGDRYVLSVKTSGADISDINVKVVDKQLTLSFRSSNAASHYENGNADVTYLSRYMGQFSKTISLPGPVAANKIKSDFKNDILTVTVPKK